MKHWSEATPHQIPKMLRTGSDLSKGREDGQRLRAPHGRQAGLRNAGERTKSNVTATQRQYIWVSLNHTCVASVTAAIRK